MGAELLDKMLDEKQVKAIKEQIIKQIDSWHASQEQKEQAKKQILDMPLEALEDFLIKNKLIKTQQNQGQNQEISEKAKETKCPFCLILQGKLQSYKIDENKNSVAVLEINPLSKGHTIIIPKKHLVIEKIPSSAFSLAKKISRKIKNKLKAKETSIQTAETFGHSSINIIPIYENEKLERKKASQEELKSLQEKLIRKKKTTTTIIRERKPKQPEQLEKAPVRIP